MEISNRMWAVLEVVMTIGPARTSEIARKAGLEKVTDADNALRRMLSMGLVESRKDRGPYVVWYATDKWRTFIKDADYVAPTRYASVWDYGQRG